MAALTHDPKFGGYALGAANGIIIEDWDEALLHRTEFRTRLSGDGALHSRSQNSGRRVRIKGFVFGGDEGLRRANEGLLVNALTSGRQLLQLFDDRFLLARLEREVKFGAVKGSGFTAREFSADFRSEWTSWEGALVTDGPFTITGFPHTRTLPNHAGTAPTWPVILIVNNGSGITDKSLLLTQIVGSQLSIQGLDIQNGQSILVDTWAGRIGDGTASAPRVASIEGDFFTIEGGTTTSIEFASNMGTVNLSVTVSFKPRYWAGA